MDYSSDFPVSSERLEAERVHLLYARSSVAALVTLAIGAILLVLLLWPAVSHTRLIAWAGFMEAVALARWAVVRRYLTKVRPPEEVGYWRSVLFLSVTITGCGWGLAGVFLSPAASLPHTVFLVTFLGGVAIVAVANLATIRPLFWLFYLLVMAPTALRLLLSGEGNSTTVGLLCLLFSGCLVLIANHMHASITESLRLRFANLDLVHTLSAAKERAEQVSAQLAASHTALRESEERFRSLIEHVSDVIMILDADGSIRYANPSVQRVLGYALEEVRGRSLGMFLHPTEHERVGGAFAALCQEPGGMRAFEFRWQGKDGSWRSVEAIAQNLLAENAVAGLILSARDITERKEVERFKEDLISTVSHELRTPLSSLRGFAELMLTREFPPPRQRQLLTIVHNEAVRLTRLINDFLDLQRLESGHQAYHFEDFDLRPLLDDSIALFSTGREEHVFRIDTADSLPAVRADVDRVRQVLANLLSNAVKFSPNGGPITVGARRQGEFVVVEVTDTGVGIPAAMLPQLFHKFFRVDSPETRGIGGTGIGLALVKLITEAHGGHVWVESRPGEGSSFFFSLPAAT